MARRTIAQKGEAGVAGADAVALNVAIDAARYDPELARKADNYLNEQQALVKLQVKLLDEEADAVNLAPDLPAAY